MFGCFVFSLVTVLKIGNLLSQEKAMFLQQSPCVLFTTAAELFLSEYIHSTRKTAEMMT